jgi:hypothetical protein
MVDLNRQIRATQARQGGFSSHVLPGAVPYAALTNLIVYYTSEAVQVTNESSDITMQYVIGFDNVPSVYGVTEFQGENAFQAIGGGGTAVVKLASFAVGLSDFTIEAWGKVGNTGFDGASLAITSGPDFRTFGDQFSYLLKLEGNTTQPRFNASLYAPEGFGFNDEFIPVSGPTHMVMQRINGELYIHVNGESVGTIEIMGCLGRLT